MNEVVRAYHFVPVEHGLDDLRRRRLKIARLDDLNDPFELWAPTQPTKEIREGLRKYKSEMSKRFGVLCFSLSWQNPLMWSHYADRHRGLALGFDISTNVIRKVKYIQERPAFRAVDEKLAQSFLYTKYAGWSYEEEARVWTTVQDPDPVSGLYFAEFSVDVLLREVIVGHLSKVAHAELKKTLKEPAGQVQVKKARLAFNSFRIVTDKRGLS